MILTGANIISPTQNPSLFQFVHHRSHTHTHTYTHTRLGTQTTMCERPVTNRMSHGKAWNDTFNLKYIEIQFVPRRKHNRLRL